MAARIAPQKQSVIRGEIAPDGVNATDGLPRKGARPNVKFDYRWHPASWIEHAKYGLIPSLRKLWYENGLNGITHKGNPTIAIAGCAARGWTIIDPKDTRLRAFDHTVFGEKQADGAMNYCRRFLVQSRRSSQSSWHWRSMFEAPRVVAGVVRWEVDQEAYQAFLRFLVDSNLITDCDPVIRESIVRKRSALVEHLEDRMANPNCPGVIYSRYETERRKLARIAGEDEDEAQRAARVVIEAVKRGNQPPALAPAPTPTAVDVVALQAQLAALQAQMDDMAPKEPEPKKKRGPGRPRKEVQADV